VVAFPGLTIQSQGGYLHPRDLFPKGLGAPWLCGGGLREPTLLLLPITGLNSSCQNGGETAWGFVKTSKLRKRPHTCFLSNRDVTRDVWASPPFFLLLKGKRKGSRKQRGAGDSLLATLGTVTSSWQGDMAPVRGARPALMAGVAGWSHPWCPLGWR